MLIKSIGFSVQPRMSNNKLNSQNIAFKAMKAEEVYGVCVRMGISPESILNLAKSELYLEKVLLKKPIDNEGKAIQAYYLSTIEAHLKRYENKDRASVFNELMAKEKSFKEPLKVMVGLFQGFSNAFAGVESYIQKGTIPKNQLTNEFESSTITLIDLEKQLAELCETHLANWSALWREVHGFQQK